MVREEMMGFEDAVSDRETVYRNLQDSYIFSRKALEQAPIEKVADKWEDAEEKTEFYIRLLSAENISGGLRDNSGLVDLGFSVLDCFYRNAQSYLEAEKEFAEFAESKNADYRTLAEEMNERKGLEYDFEENTQELLEDIEELDDLYWEEWGIEFLEGWQ